jgi:hypothetical protein
MLVCYKAYLQVNNIMFNLEADVSEVFPVLMYIDNWIFSLEVSFLGHLYTSYP